MKFEISTTLGSRIVSNDELIKMVSDFSPLKGAERDNIQQKMLKTLEYTGAKERRWLQPDENSYDMTMNNIAQLIEKSNTKIEDIDVVIFVGVHKPFAEPANASFVAKHFGIKAKHIFDVTEACQSWMRGCFVAKHLLAKGKKALVVSSEFNLTKGKQISREKNFIRTVAEFQHLFAVLTVGESTTATLLSFDGEEKGVWDFISIPELADLCYIPLEGSEDWRTNDKLTVNRLQNNQFISFGKELHDGVEPIAAKIIETLREKHNVDGVSKIFTHASSSRMWDNFAKTAKLDSSLIHHVYPMTGNLVSSSIPVAMDQAAKEGFDFEKENFLLWCGSAGASVGVYLKTSK